MIKISPVKIQTLQNKILNWYTTNKRDLPWRTTQEPYHILVSEIMLQQTQVDRVIPYYHKWLETFPTLESLAKAEKTLILKNWSGLGYNNRPLRLQQLAQQLTQKSLPFPTTYVSLVELPGIGPYTANAILAFAFNQSVPVIDTNIRRVLIHELHLPEAISLENLQIIAQQCIPKDKSKLWHNALMDYGALYATSRKTGIESLSKQSKFEGSTRQVRSNIVKYLLENKTTTLERLKSLYSHKEFNTILEKMLKEGLVKQKENTLTL